MLGLKQSREHPLRCLHHTAPARRGSGTWSRRGRSACRDSDPDVFFPIGTTGPALEQIETARRICTACLVSEECLDFALATNQEAGIWGGTTEEERRKLRKAWLQKQRATA